MEEEKGEKESATSLPYQRGVTGALGAASLSVSHFAVQRPSTRPTITWNRTPVLRELIEFLGASPTIFSHALYNTEIASTPPYALSRMSSVCEISALC